MALLKGFWKLLVGIKDFLVLMLMLIIFIGIITALNYEEEARPGIADGALTIPMSGLLVTEKQDVDPFVVLTGGSVMPEIETSELVRVLAAAKADARIEAVVLDMDGFLGGGLADVQAVADAVADFRSAGKYVYSFGNAYLDDSWLIAAHGDEIWLSPLGMTVIQGPGGSSLYFGEALERLKIDVNVFRVGTFKSFVEPYTESEASEPARQARQALVDDLWDLYREDAAAARPTARIDGYVSTMPDIVRSAGGDFALAARAAGLVDEVGTRIAFGEAVAEIVGADGDSVEGYRSVPYELYAASLPSPGGEAVGIVNVVGTIVDGEADTGAAGGDSVSQLIDTALSDSNVKALVINIDSGGGSVTASEQIRQALLQARTEGVPVIARFGPVAASGGYWIATAADQIVAAPASVTGSIGVFAILPTFENALAEIGINADGVETTPLSGAPDIFGGLNETTEAVFQLGVEDTYRRFINIVAEARDMTPARADEIGQGRVWSGAAARQLDLVDSFGTLEDAVALAEEAAGYSAGELAVRQIRQPKPFGVAVLEEFLTMDAGADKSRSRPVAAFDLERQRQIAELSAAVGDIRALATGASVQARCYDCMLSGRAVAPDERGLLEGLKALID
ncbi:MAG: signal peptide peptidase SppA [Pacificimonas sp.]|jgi:protease-4|nr:signal peptide peptidase SppA [Pacificimonas sp.]